MRIETQYRKLTPSLGINFVSRRFDFYQSHLSITYFDYMNIEVPLSAIYRQKLNATTRLMVFTGISIDYVLTPTKSSTLKGISGYGEYTFSIINNKNLMWTLNAGAGIETDLHSIGRVGISFQWHIQLKPYINYRGEFYDPSTSDKFIFTTKNYRLNYFMVSVFYYLPAFKRNEENYSD